jgi:hypothetical protein
MSTPDLSPAVGPRRAIPARVPTRVAAVPALIAAALTAAAIPTVALAQAPNAEVLERPRPPTPGKKDSPSVLLYYLVLVVLLGLVFGANAIPSKRGHQD